MSFCAILQLNDNFGMCLLYVSANFWQFNPFDSKGNYTATSNNTGTKLVLCLLMGGWYSEKPVWAAAPPSPLTLYHM